jgi:cell division control protein 6
MTRIDSRGHNIDDVKSRFDSVLSGKSIIILEGVNFLQDYDILYHLTRHTRANLVLLTQKVYWFKDMNDESVKRSLQQNIGAHLT